MKYHSLFVIFKNAAKFEIVVGGALSVKSLHVFLSFVDFKKNI